MGSSNVEPNQTTSYKLQSHVQGNNIHDFGSNSAIGFNAQDDAVNEV